MKENHSSLFSERLVKLICIFGLLILCPSTLIQLVKYNFNVVQWIIDYSIYAIVNIVVICLFTIVYFKPRKVEILSIASLSYTILCICFEESYLNVMGLFMYYLSITLLVCRGFYHTHKELKITITVLVLLGLYTARLQFGLSNYLDSMMQVAGYSLVLFCILSFIIQYINNKNITYFKSRILDLSDYDENQLSVMDREWLEMALTNEKYDTIARKYGYSEGHVKNRMHYIFATIDVLDRIDLFSKYAGCRVIKNKEELKQWKQEILEKV